MGGQRAPTDYGNGRIHKLVRVRAAADGEERWLVKAAADGDYQRYEAIVVQAQSGLAFTAANAVQRSRSSPASLFLATSSSITVLEHIYSAQFPRMRQMHYSRG